MTDQTNQPEPAPLTAKEQRAMTEISKWWRGVCVAKEVEPPPDDFRACVDAAFSFMAECRARAQMPAAPTRVV